MCQCRGNEEDNGEEAGVEGNHPTQRGVKGDNLRHAAHTEKWTIKLRAQGSTQLTLGDFFSSTTNDWLAPRLENTTELDFVSGNPLFYSYHETTLTYLLAYSLNNWNVIKFPYESPGSG